MSKFGLCLSLSVPSAKLLSSQDAKDDHPALPFSGHNTGDSRSRTPKSASKAESAIEAFDITDLSRSETAREERRCDIQFVQCLRGFDDKRNEPWPPPSLASIWSPKPQETPAHWPPPFHALRLFSCLSYLSLRPADLAWRLGSRGSVLRAPYLRT
jgi:hypothetical protein